MTEEKVVSFRGGPVHFNHLAPGQLFAPQEVIDGTPIGELAELVVIGRTHTGQMYLAATHNTAAVSLLLGNASHFIHRAFASYGADE